MSDDPLDRIPAFDRISVPAVLVQDGEDADAALNDAGIPDPVAIPVLIGEVSGPFDGSADHQIERGLTGAFEVTVDDWPSAPAPSVTDRFLEHDSYKELAPRRTANLPDAFGSRPIAPIRIR